MSSVRSTVAHVELLQCRPQSSCNGLASLVDKGGLTLELDAGEVGRNDEAFGGAGDQRIQNGTLLAALSMQVDGS